MKASELVAELQNVVRQHGDLEVFLDVSCHGLQKVDEVGVDTEDTGIIIWGEPKSE